jgi:Zn-dependent M28 family amino/carboxypeptidase
MRIIAGTAMLLLAFAARAGAQGDDLAAVLAGFSVAEVRAHLTFLSDDVLEGRAPGTRGGRLATRYIATQFQRSGLQPPETGWFQPVPLIAWSPHRDLIAGDFETRGRRIPVRHPDDAVFWVRDGRPAAATAAQVVFVGYGVSAPEWQWDDFGDVDLRGRVALILANDPPAPPEEPARFDGAAMTWYGRWSYKLEEVARRGAIGALIVHTDQGAGYPWDVVMASWAGEQLFLTRDSSGPAVLEGWIRAETARFVLNAAGLDFDQLVARAGRRDFQPIATGITLRARASGERRSISSDNVVGVLPGRHPTRRDEAVVITAHWDHLGTGAPVDGDSIYNGAYDNASGVALLLEIARVFARLDPAPDRSIVFIATTAEEPGLLGATHYLTAPAFPPHRTAAAINLDGANLWGETFDVSAVGAERSTLGRVVELRARDLGLRLSPERAPEKGGFYRSDLFPFARAGIPAIQIDHGLEFRDRPPGWGARTLTRYEASSYHRPSDELTPDLDLSGAIQQARLAFLVARDVARTPTFPTWLPGSVFRRSRLVSQVPRNTAVAAERPKASEAGRMVEKLPGQPETDP